MNLKKFRAGPCLLKPAIAFAALLASLPCAEAGIVFTNFQSGIGGIEDIENVGLNPQSLAANFIPNGDFTMTDAQVKVQENGTALATFNLSLFTDNGGLPGALIGVIGGGTAPTGAFGIVDVNSPAFPLFMGASYWLVGTPAASGSDVEWTSLGFPGAPSAFTTDATGASGWGNANATSFQFQIDGTQAPTPEPASFALCGIGLAAACLTWRFRGKGTATAPPQTAA